VIDARKLVAEALGTAFLLAIVVGSGIMGQRLALGNDAIALLANSTATGAGLIVLILVFGPISGAHFNPAVTLVAALRKEISVSCALAFVAAQVAGAFAGVAAAHVMFELPLYTPSTHIRSGAGQWWSEFVATFGLILVILSCVKYRPDSVAFAVAGYIAAAYWFTASTCFANPAVTLARATTNTFAGIYPGNVALFISAQIPAALTSWRLFDWLSGANPRRTVSGRGIEIREHEELTARRATTAGSKGE
jgi:glycerol uptake facilitator-like aquaporin